MPKVKQSALTAAFVRSVKDAGNFTDGNGLALRVSPQGRKSWIQRVTIDGKQTALSVGAYPAVSLADARAIAQDNARTTAQGRNPQAEKRQAKQEARKPSIPPFEDAARAVHSLHAPNWSNAKHAHEWLHSLETHAFPTLGRKSVDSITTADIMSVLTPIWNERAVTAKRLNQRLAVIFDYCIAQGWRETNPAGRSVSKALPKPSKTVEHHAAAPYADVPAILRKVRESGECELIKLSFEFAILTAARTGEIRFATWDEINWECQTWEIPAARMKMRRPHRVPLAARAREILERAREITGGEGLIFPGKKAAALYHRAHLSLLQRLGIEATPHGFRSSFRDWMGECTGASWAVAESSLAHVQGNATQQAYARSDYLELRRPIMQQWADFLTG